jgi:hypothetical protein
MFQRCLSGAIPGAMIIVLFTYLFKLFSGNTVGILLLLLPVFGGAVAGFIVDQGVADGLVTGLLTMLVAVLTLGVIDIFLTFFHGKIIDIDALINESIDLSFRMTIPAVVGGLIGTLIRKAQIAISR